MNYANELEFILCEVLQPFTESSLFQDYAADYAERTGRADFAEQFNAAMVQINDQVFESIREVKL